jgi:ribose 5-phosphate isomerase A
MTQDELKALVGRAALDHVVAGELVGVGTGSTVNHFIDALATMKDRIAGAVSRCSIRSTCGGCRSMSTAPTRSTAAAA